jgi:hypothetical protein
MFSDRKFVVIGVGMTLIWLFAMTMMLMPSLIKTWPEASSLFCSGDNCTIQGWLSALSGWFAFGAALHTFKYFRNQISEQKRQTDFIIGNDDPTLDSIQHLEDSEEVILRIVNWNRRGVLIHDMDFLGRDLVTGIMKVKINGRKDIMARMPIFLRGWEKRNSEGPETAQFTLSAHEKDVASLLKEWPLGQQVFADIQILGEKHRRKRLVCDMNVAGTAP